MVVHLRPTANIHMHEKGIDDVKRTVRIHKQYGNSICCTQDLNFRFCVKKI